MTCRFVGKLVIMFGVATFVASVVASFAAGEFLVDLGAPIIVVLGVYVARGSARAARVCVVVTACYVILPLLLLVVAAMGTQRLLEGPRFFFGDEAVKPLEHMMRVLELPWLTPACLVVGAAAAVVTLFLAILVYRLRRTAATPPPPPQQEAGDRTPTH